MDFIKKRVLHYHEKKLDETISKIKFHSDMKRDIEQKIKKEKINPSDPEIKKEISFHKEMIDIWTKNRDKIKREIKKIQK